jgi:hypothetical protein
MIRQQQVDKSSCFTSTLDVKQEDLFTCCCRIMLYPVYWWSRKTCLLAAVVSYCIQCTGEAGRLVYLLLSYHTVSSVLVKQEDLSTCCCHIIQQQVDKSSCFTSFIAIQFNSKTINNRGNQLEYNWKPMSHSSDGKRSHAIRIVLP